MKMLLAMAPTIILMVYGQLLTKWRVQTLSESGLAGEDGFQRMVGYLLDPYILSAYVTTFAASIAWMFVVERYALSAAFPIYIGLTVALVAVGGVIFFAEPLDGWRILSIVLILSGVAIGSRS